MDSPSSAAVVTLVSEITDLKKALAGTLVDQAAIDARYDAMTSGLLTAAGSLDTAKWETLSPERQAQVKAELSKLRQELEDLREVYANEDGPADERSYMHKAYASNRAIKVLTLIALLGLFGDLALICHEWEAATAGSRGILEFGTSSYSTRLAKADATGTTATPAPTPKESADKEEMPGKVTEQAVLWMVILLGALGGFLYLASSMATYVGNRQLLKSWIIYYILIPFQGAALAPLIYLLLRVGVLNPANTTASGRPMQSLNLMGIYAFAALTGLFSKQAIEMLADVFATIFKKVSAKDSLEKSKTDKDRKSSGEAP